MNENPSFHGGVRCSSAPSARHAVGIAAHHGRRALARGCHGARVASRRRRDPSRIHFKMFNAAFGPATQIALVAEAQTTTRSWRSSGTASSSVSRPTPSAGSRARTSSWPLESTGRPAADRSLGLLSALTARRLWLGVVLLDLVDENR